jgi:CHAD domain-containing protein
MPEETASSATPAEQTVPTPPEFALLAFLDGLMHDLRTQVPVAMTQWQAEAVHQSRVATRRMKAALDLMKPVLRRRPRRKLDRTLRKLRRRLAPLRDADVMLGHLAELGADGQHASAVRWLTERLSREREELRRESAKRSTPTRVLEKLDLWQPVREELQAAREAVNSLLAESLHLQLDTFTEQADRLAAAVNSQADEPSPPRQDPHELRIAGKALRYTLEMAVVQGHDLPNSLTKTFKRMQDALGLWHDFVVLADRAMYAAMDEGLAHHDPAAMNEIFEMLRNVLARSTQNLSQFKQLWAAEGDAVAKSIRTTFPLTRASEAQTVADAQPASEGASA